MPWVYLDDHFPEHPKVQLAGGDAAWLFVCGLAYCRRHNTAGRIPKPTVSVLTDRKKPLDLALRLVAVGLWEHDGDDWFRIHDYNEWNRPQESRSEAARKAAEARWDAKRNADASKPHTERTGDADASTCPPSSPLTTDYKSSSSSTSVRGPASEEEEGLLHRTWDAFASLKHSEQVEKGQKIGNVARWKASVARNAALEHRDEALRIAGMFPAITAEQLARCLMGDKSCLRFLDRVS